ncbi:hypothetical protein [Streptomyces sp. NPDC002994]|uniref:hypothetical protein n=1 Tax=Streptomyces sp. NPDC002994 TaxID=3154441 RepID=UPI0033AB7AB9
MTINHRAEALRLAEESHGVLRPHDEGPCEADRLLAEAQIHATLARDEERAAATADLRDAITLLRRREYATREAVSSHIAQALASREADRWKAGLNLAKALDEADCNMDALVDARLTDDGWDPRSAYKAPASAVRRDDPWAATPDITAEVPEPVRRVIAERLADMLLSRQDDGWGAEQARRFAFALKNEGADLTGDIEKRIRDLTLGRDPSDPPF